MVQAISSIHLPLLITSLSSHLHRHPSIMRSFAMLIPTLSFIFITLIATQALADIAKRAASPYGKLSAADLDKQARKELSFIQTKLTQKVTIVNSGGGKGGNVGMMMKRTKQSQSAAKRSNAAPWLSQRQVGISRLTASYYDMLWGVPFQVVNGKTANLAWDTGSSLTIFNHDAYTPSSLAQESGQRARIAYLDGTTGEGPIYFDYITVAGLDNMDQSRMGRYEALAV